MEITIRSIAQYKEVKIDADMGLTWKSGALDRDECLELAKEFIEAAAELLPDRTEDSGHEMFLAKDILATISERI